MDAQVDLAVLEGREYARALGRRLIARVGGGGDRARRVGVGGLEQLNELGETCRGLDRLGEAERVGDAGRVQQVEEQQRLVLGRRRDVVLLLQSDLAAELARTARDEGKAKVVLPVTAGPLRTSR